MKYPYAWTNKLNVNMTHFEKHGTRPTKTRSPMRAINDDRFLNNCAIVGSGLTRSHPILSRQEPKLLGDVRYIESEVVATIVCRRRVIICVNISSQTRNIGQHKMGRMRSLLALACAWAAPALGYHAPDPSATSGPRLATTRRAFSRPLVAAAGLLWGETARGAVPTYDEYLVGQPGSAARTGAAPKPPPNARAAAAVPAATNRLSSLAAGKLPPLASVAELRAALLAADAALLALEPMLAKQVCCAGVAALSKHF